MGNENAFTSAFPKIFMLTYRDKMFFLETVRLVLILLDFTSDFCYFSPVETDRHKNKILISLSHFANKGLSFPSRPHWDELIIGEFLFFQCFSCDRHYD